MARITKKNHDTATRNQVVGLRKAGSTFKKIAEVTAVSSSTAQRIWAKFNETGTVADRPRSGRPPIITSDTERRQIRRIALKFQFKSFQWVKEYMGLAVSVRTIARILKKFSLSRSLARMSPALRKHHRRERCKWAAAMRGVDINTLLYSDESMFYQTDTSTRRFVTRGAGEATYARNVQTVWKRSGGGTMVFGAIAKGFKSPLIFLSWPVLRTGVTLGKFNSFRYINQCLEPLSQCLNVIGVPWDGTSGVRSVEDNAPVHNSKETQEARELLNVPRFQHPPNSPDLNPIERVWGGMKAKLRARNTPISSVEELKSELTRLWDEYPQSKIDSYIDHVLVQVKEVRMAKGGVISKPVGVRRGHRAEDHAARALSSMTP